MSIKKLVNDPEIYKAFLEEIEERSKVEVKNMMKQTDSVLMYRHQGALLMLEKLKRLREDVNARK